MFVFVACENADVEKINEPQTDDECLTVRGLNNGKVIEGQYIIAINHPEGSNGRVEDATRALINRNKITDNRIVRVSDGALRSIVMKLSKSEADALSKDADVLYFEQDRVVSICACFTVIEPRSITWSVEKVGFDNGVGKTAWIIDTGIDLDHPDLNVDKVRSKSFIQDQTSANDENGHGTHVAGIIGAMNNRFGLLGVASGATLVALKVLDTEGEGLMSTVIAA
ncbi:MAG: peptidase S8, partial [Marivirga sp.]|nr:peptidase S8 [Marivirga sp.]